VAAFRSQSLAHTCFPYLFVDATYLKARVDGRVVSRAVVIATGVTADGAARSWAGTSAMARTAVLDRVPALAQGPRADRVQLVVSDAHTGLRQAIAAVMAAPAGNDAESTEAVRNQRVDVPVFAGAVGGVTEARSSAAVR
jgi:putative transposase